LKYINTVLNIFFKEENMSLLNLIYTKVKALISRRLKQFRSDLDPNFFGSCLAPEPDPDLNGHENKDPDRIKFVRIHNTGLAHTFQGRLLRLDYSTQTGVQYMYIRTKYILEQLRSVAHCSIRKI